MRLLAWFDDSDVVKRLEAAAAAGAALGPMWRDLKADMRADQLQHAKEQAGPDGKWPARAPSTIEKLRTRSASGRRRRARRPLGKLPGSTTYTATSRSVLGISRVPWSDVHQTGGRVGKGHILPARPYLWISDGLAEKVARAIEKRVMRGFEA